MDVNKILEGNCLTVLKTLPDNSIDCCITSPPYWGLRDYGHIEQLGQEKHFTEFVENLCNIFDEIKRVVKPTGSCFVNLGDTYGTQSGCMAGGLIEPKYGHKETRSFKQPNVNMHKSLCMVPERFAIEMTGRGWTVRNQIIWHKPNQMPSSATDRFTVDFEKIFFFVKEPMGYYFEQQLEPSLTYENRKGGLVRDREKGYDSKQDKVRISLGKKSFSKAQATGKGVAPSGNGTKDFYELPFEKNMRTVWSVNTEPNSEAHFATYPQRLVERMIKSGCPENGIVLDPFFGSGTTGICARKINRNFIGIELNPAYIEIANKRINKELGMFK